MPRASPGRSASYRWAILALKLAATAAVAWFVLRRVGPGFDWEELRRGGIGELRWGALALATLVQAVGLFIGATVWGLVVESTAGSGPSMLAGARIWMIGGLGRYLPGKVFGFLGVVALARRAGVAAASAGIAVGVASLLGMVAAAVLGSALYFDLRPELGPAEWLALALAIASLAALHAPPLQERLLDLWLRTTRSEHPGRSARGAWGSGMSRWTGISLASWVLHATAFWLLAESLGLSIPPLVAGPAFALAWLLGWVSPLPLGAGVRELGLVGLLAGHAGDAQLVGLAVAARLWATIIELAVCAALWLAVGGSGAAAKGGASADPS